MGNIKRIIVLLTIICNVISCSNKQESKKQISSSQPSEYPKIINSLGLKDLYNQTQWLMYCYQCDDTLKTTKAGILGDSITFGMLTLKFDTIQKFRDSLTEIKLNFYYNETMINDSFSRNIPIWGIVFNDSNKKIIYYLDHSDFSYMTDSCPPKVECKSRFLKPLQPEVIKYIKENKERINPWFRKEAVKRGVIKD